MAEEMGSYFPLVVCFCIFPLERESWELNSRGGKQEWILEAKASGNKA